MEGQERTFDWMGQVLRFRVGMVFPAGQEPENVEGLIEQPAPEDAKVTKFYLRPAQVDLLKEQKVVYSIPPSVSEAPYGELVLNRRPGYNVLFGRQGEDRTFTFRENQYYIYLRIQRGEGGFNPLLVLYDDFYGLVQLKFTVRWEGNSIIIDLQSVNQEY